MISSWEDNTIDLIYLDPPFNSKAHYNIVFGNQPNGVDFTAFNDMWHWDAGAVEQGKVTASKNQNDRVALWNIEDRFKGIQPKILDRLDPFTGETVREVPPFNYRKRNFRCPDA